MRVLTAISLFFCAASPIAAQTRPLSDSIMALNRAGKWEQAGQLADRAIRTAPNVEERCAVFVGGLYAAARLSLISTGPRQLTVFDDMCANTTAARQSARDIEEIRRVFTLPPMPTGVDWSGVDQFWMAVDTLSRDIEPTPAQWRALLISPGYRIATISHPGIARSIELAFKPSRRAQRDSVLGRGSEDSATISHLLVAAAAREELRRFRAALEPPIRSPPPYKARRVFCRRGRPITPRRSSRSRFSLRTDTRKRRASSSTSTTFARMASAISSRTSFITRMAAASIEHRQAPAAMRGSIRRSSSSRSKASPT
jgi:hypothetical protein